MFGLGNVSKKLLNKLTNKTLELITGFDDIMRDDIVEAIDKMVSENKEAAILGLAKTIIEYTAEIYGEEPVNVANKLMHRAKQDLDSPKTKEAAENDVLTIEAFTGLILSIVYLKIAKEELSKEIESEDAER